MKTGVATGQPSTEVYSKDNLYTHCKHFEKNPTPDGNDFLWRKEAANPSGEMRLYLQIIVFPQYLFIYCDFFPFIAHS